MMMMRIAVVRAKIQISKTSEELQEHIDPAQLLSNLGGKNGWKWTYEPVEKGENEMMGCVVEKKHELQNRQKLIKAYQDLTRIWAAAVESSSEQQSGGSEENPINSLAILPEDPSPHARLRTFVMYHLRVHYFILVRRLPFAVAIYIRPDISSVCRIHTSAVGRCTIDKAG